jgi:hypothetical protein
VAGSSKHDNELSSSIKGGDFLELLGGVYLPKKASVPWTYINSIMHPLSKKN